MKIYNTYKEFEVTFADKASVLPLVQQVVGCATIASNLIKIIVDLAQFSFCSIQADYANKAVDLERHVKYLHIGVLRALPLIGSKYSFERCGDPSTETIYNALPDIFILFTQMFV